MKLCLGILTPMLSPAAVYRKHESQFKDNVQVSRWLQMQLLHSPHKYCWNYQNESYDMLCLQMVRTSMSQSRRIALILGCR